MTLTATAAPARDSWTVGGPLALLLAGGVLRWGAYATLHAATSLAGFAGAMCVWDCAWYGDIVLHGYQAQPETLNFGGPAGIANWAFFPLYPLLIALVQRLVPLAPALLGAIVSPLLTLAAVFAAQPLFGGDRRAYLLFAALLLAGPFSFYFATLYSESLFLLLTVAAFVALGRRNYLAAGLWGALLAATRSVGVLFVFALLLEAALELRGRGAREMLRRPDIVFGALLVPCGVFAFMAWLYLVTGDALAFAHIQRGWDRELVNPAMALWDAITAPQGQVRGATVLGLATLAGLALSGVLAWQRQWAMAAFSGLCLMLALTQGVESNLRFVAGLAPLGIALCGMLAQRRWLFWPSLVVFAGLDFELSLGWMQQQSALM
jgi:hypothetical protein